MTDKAAYLRAHAKAVPHKQDGRPKEPKCVMHKKHQTDTRLTDNNLEVENSGEKRGLQNTTKTTRKRQEPNHRRGKEERKTKLRKKRKREKKNTDQKSSRAEPGGKRQEGKGKGRKRARPQPERADQATTNAERRGRQEQEEEEEGENNEAELPSCATNLITGQTPEEPLTASRDRLRIARAFSR